MANVIINQSPPVASVVTTAVVQHAPRIREHYASKTSIVLGVIQVVCGILAVVFGIMGLVWEAYSGGSAYGIWCGVPIIVGGTLGIVAGRTKQVNVITGYLAMSIIDVCVAGLCGLIALVAVINDRVDYTVYDYGYYGYFEERGHHADRVATSAILLTSACVAGCTFIWSSVISGNCCNSTPTTTYITHNPGVSVFPQHTIVTNPGTVVTHQQQMGVVQHHQPQMQYAYNGPALQPSGAPQQAPPYGAPQQAPYGAPQQGSYNSPPESFEKPPPYVPQ